MGWSRPASEAALYGAALLVLAVSQWLLWGWIIEDAAISLAYARNIAQGMGPVPYPGAPPTEGYSNPLWVALLVPFMGWLDGADPFPTVRWLGLGLSLLGTVATAAVARPTLGHRGAALAAFFFAAFAPMNIWAQSGLENALYSLLLALGLWRLQVDGSRSWAALCFLGLALTRPEAGAIAVIGFASAVAFAVPTGQVGARVRDWVRWALVPFIAYQGLRYFAFAAELPATAYAKVDDRPLLWSFHAKGWQYLRRFAVQAGFVVWLPAMFFALGGAARDDGPRSSRIAAAVASGLLVLGFVARWLGVLSDDASVLACMVVGAGVTALGLGQGGIRSTLTAVSALGVLFALFADGDWMRGWRWFSLISVPIAYAFAATVEHILRALPRPTGPALAAVLLGGFTGHQLYDLAWVADGPATSPWTIRRRVEHYLDVADTLQLRRRPLVIDQDLGANLWWGGPHYDVRDAKGLTDLPFALHRPRPLAADALLFHDAFELPTFVHLHVVTKRTLQARPWFRERYVEVPGYANANGSEHDGQFVRRDVILEGEWKGKRRPLHFEGVQVLGWQTRSPEVSAGTGLYFEIAVELTEPSDRPIDLLLTARGASGATQSWSLPLGYDLFPADRWEPGEVFVGRYPLPLDDGLPEGSYTLALAMQRGDTILPPAPPTRANRGGGGVVHLGPAMRIVPRDVMDVAAADDLATLEEKSKKRSCFSAEDAWEDALAHRIRSPQWQAAHEPAARESIATCWANRAGKKANRLRDTFPEVPKGEDPSPDAYLEKAAWEIQRARTWSPTNERLLVNAHRVANLLEARSRTFEAKGDDDSAFRYLALAAKVDPSRPFLQRRTERWRARRLGFEDRLGPLPP